MQLYEIKINDEGEEYTEMPEDDDLFGIQSLLDKLTIYK